MDGSGAMQPAQGRCTEIGIINCPRWCRNLSTELHKRPYRRSTRAAGDLRARDQRAVLQCRFPE